MSTDLSIVYSGTALVPLPKVIGMLAAELSIERVSDFAKAVEAARRYDSANCERWDYWGELAIWSSRRIGELIIEGQRNGEVARRGGDRKSNGQRGRLVLREVLGTETDEQAKNISKRSQKLAAREGLVQENYLNQRVRPATAWPK